MVKHKHTHKAFTLLQINFPLGYATFHVEAGGFCYPTLFSVPEYQLQLDFQEFYS